MKRGFQMALVLAVVCGAGACSGSEGGKAGPGSERRTLVLGTGDPENSPAGEQVKEFARLVGEKSGGRLKVEPRWEPGGTKGPGWDQAAAKMVRDGTLQLGLIATRAWAGEGVSSMNALQAPFLVSSDAFLDQIVTGDLAPKMLSGLDGIGLTGLALVPENLRHPFGRKQALTKPQDFTGKTLRVATSEVSSALFKALGATAQDYDADTLGRAIGNGTVIGAESSYPWAAKLPGTSWVATGNVTFYPKVNSLVVRKDVLDGLPSEQQKALKDAAAQTVYWASTHRVNELDGAKEHCQRGGSVVNAGAAELAALKTAAQPVYAQLEQDPTTQQVIAGIRALVAGEPATIPPCGRAPKETTSPKDAAAQANFPAGVYRKDNPVDFMLAQGVPREWALDNQGLSTLTVKDGRWRHHVGEGKPDSEDCYGPYTVSGGRITFALDEVLCGTTGGYVFSATWTRKGDDLQFTDVVAGQEGEESLMKTLFGTRPWKKIS